MKISHSTLSRFLQFLPACIAVAGSTVFILSCSDLAVKDPDAMPESTWQSEAHESSVAEMSSVKISSSSSDLIEQSSSSIKNQTQSISSSAISSSAISSSFVSSSSIVFGSSSTPVSSSTIRVSSSATNWCATAGRCGIYTDQRQSPSPTYKWVIIGTQKWMAQNLNYPTATGSMCYDNSIPNCNSFGRLYTWDAAMVACPSGWRLASDEDWQTLEVFAGMSSDTAKLADWRGIDVGTKLMAPSSLWTSGAQPATDDYEFAVLPGGQYLGVSEYKGSIAFFWTSTKDGSYPWQRSMNRYHTTIARNVSSVGYYFSVRCVEN